MKPQSVIAQPIPQQVAQQMILLPVVEPVINQVVEYETVEEDEHIIESKIESMIIDCGMNEIESDTFTDRDDSDRKSVRPYCWSENSYSPQSE